jgi:nucleotide-binding universal stress UspA family protein
VLWKELNMYKRLLVPIDGSETARLGLEEAVRLGKSTGGRIRLIHVVNELPLVSPTMTGTVMSEIIDALREQGTRMLASAEDTVRSAGLEAETKLVEAMGGPAGEQVVRDAAAWPADVIVCGTHGRRGVRRIVMGSDAEYILRHTPVPVLLVRASES